MEKEGQIRRGLSGPNIDWNENIISLVWKKLNSLFGKENVFVGGGILSNQEVAGFHHKAQRYNTKLTTLILKTHQRLFPANKKKHDCAQRVKITGKSWYVGTLRQVKEKKLMK